MGNKHIYYLVGPDAPVRTVINQCIEEIKAANRAAKDFQVRHHAKQALVYADSGKLAGLVFADGIPTGWREVEGRCVPNQRLKVGKTIAAEMQKLPKGISALEFTDRITTLTGVDCTVFEDGHIYFCTFGVYGDKLVLGVPSGVSVELSGCYELKMSEYIAITREGNYQAA